MQGPRSPEKHEFSEVVQFLNQNLRQNNNWTIASEYPTAFSTNNIHNMSIITEDEKIVSHAVLRTLIIKTPMCILKVGAIGSVFTDPSYRQKGHSRKNIQNCIDLAIKQDCDLVILWTDQFDFYRKLGFELAGYEYSYALEQEMNVANQDELRYMAGNNVDPNALLKLYSNHSVNSVRSLDDFTQYLKIPNSNLYTAWSKQNQLMAYAVEGKGVDLVNYIHEWAGKTEALMGLFAYIRKNKNQPITVMVPSQSTNLRTQLENATQFCHQGFLGMIKIINKDSLLAKVKKAFRAEGLDKIVFEQQQTQLVFGYGADLYTLDRESDLTQLLFGPLNAQDLSFVTPETQNKLAQVLPLPLWVWGWDSI